MPSPAEPTPPETPPSTASPDKAPNSSAAARSRPAPSHDCRVSMRSGNYPQYGDRSTSWPAGYPVAPDQGDRERQDPVRGANRSRRIVGREDVGRPRTRGGPSLSVGPGQGMALRFVERNLGPVPEMGTAVPGLPWVNSQVTSTCLVRHLPLKCHSIEGGTRLHIRKAFMTWSPLTESNRRPSPYHGSPAGSVTAGRAPDQHGRGHRLAPASPGQALTSSVCHSICHSLRSWPGCS